MNKMGRPPTYSETQFREVWRLRKEGYKPWDISQMLHINPGSIHLILHQYGGIAPAVSRQRDGHLTIEERESISRGLAANLSVTRIAHNLNRSVSTISREISRHGGKAAYRATAAHLRAHVQRQRPKPFKLETNDPLRRHVLEKLALNWSPEQIKGELFMSYPNDESMRISHETIYKLIYVQARGALKQALCIHLRSKRKLRKSKSTRARQPGKARSSMRSPSENVRQRRTTGLCPGIGRATCYWAPSIPRSQRWWNGAADS